MEKRRSRQEQLSRIEAAFLDIERQLELIALRLERVSMPETPPRQKPPGQAGSPPQE